MLANLAHFTHSGFNSTNTESVEKSQANLGIENPVTITGDYFLSVKPGDHFTFPAGIRFEHLYVLQPGETKAESMARNPNTIIMSDDVFKGVHTMNKVGTPWISGKSKNIIFENDLFVKGIEVIGLI